MEKLSKVDREYREKLIKINRLYGVAIIFMLLCSGILFAGTYWYKLKISGQAVGFLTGFFFSISVVFLINILRNRQTVKDPEKLKQHRISRMDERNLEISSKALQITGYVMAIVLALLSMIGSFISRTLMITSSALLYVFLISYLVCYFYFRKKL